MEVRDERGGRFKFGDLIRERKTIVVFIRHCELVCRNIKLDNRVYPCGIGPCEWLRLTAGFCPLCAQYMSSIVSTVTPHALEQAGVNLIIIGNGSYKMLDGYKSEYGSIRSHPHDSIAVYLFLKEISQLIWVEY